MSEPFEYSRQCDWGKKFPMCLGMNQSPIEINCREATSFNNVPPMKFHGFNRIVPGESWIMRNNGHTANLKMCPHYSKKPRVDGGFLPGVFIFENVHFHWGSSDRKGSEHVLNNKRFGLEMHMLYKNDKYCNMDTAISRKDGLLVLSVLFKKATDVKFSPIFNIVDRLEDIEYFGNKTKFDEGFSLGSLFPIKKNRYYNYQGSLTIPPCSESVTWVVFEQYLPITSGELNEFRKLKDHNEEPMVDNFRKVQAVGDRIVVKVK